VSDATIETINFALGILLFLGILLVFAVAMVGCLAILFDIDFGIGHVTAPWDRSRRARDGKATPAAVEPIEPNILRDMARPNVLGGTGREPEATPANLLARAAAWAGLSGASVDRLKENATQFGRARLPGVSGRWSALVLMGLFGTSAIVVPLTLHRALWVEAEAVIVVWFTIWVVALTWLAYSGRSVEQDWGPYQSLWDRLKARTGSSPLNYWSGAVNLPSDGGGEGCLTLLLTVIAVVLILLLLYLTIGWVVPFVAIILYALLRAMLNRVTDRAEETKGNLPAALVGGVFWALLYTGPLALVVWAIHVVA